MAGFDGDAVRTAGDTISEVRAEREARTHIRDQARASRRLARSLRDRAIAAREANLVHRWRLWSEGLLTEPPDFIPVDWSRALGFERTITRAAQACHDCAATCEAIFSARKRGLPREVTRTLAAIAATAAVTENRLVLDPAESLEALAVCALVIERAEPILAGPWHDAELVLAASAGRRCGVACRAALTALYAELDAPT
jgi:hypothetical protein